MALEDVIRAEIFAAADEGEPDMTPREVEALTIRLARRLRPLLIGGTPMDLPSQRRAPRQGRPTERQRHTLELLADSVDRNGIAEALGVTTQTVRDHLARLAKRLAVQAEPCQMVNAGFEQGWLPVPEERPVMNLDLRDLTALGLLAAGRQAEIGVVLGLSATRVKSQRDRLMSELGAATDAGLVAAAWRTGLLPVVPTSSELIAS